MLENIKVFSSDEFWNRILVDLGVCIADKPDVADVILDNIEIPTPICVDDLKSLILSLFNNNDIIIEIFGRDIALPLLHRKIIATIYKNPNIDINKLKLAVGVSPEITTHSVENAIYQLRKTYGHDFILNTGGGYKIGCL